MNWRHLLVVLHRDIGFLCLGLTLVYGLSGLAVNHRHHWNPNQSESLEERTIGKPAQLLTRLSDERRAEIIASAASITREEEQQLVQAIGVALGREGSPKNVFWRGPDRLNLFFEGGDRVTIDYEPSTGAARLTTLRERPLLRNLNFLHRNEAHGGWTWIADLFALSLVFLGISGALIVKGRTGLLGRGGILVAIGVVIPIAAVVIERYL